VHERQSNVCLGIQVKKPHKLPRVVELSKALLDMTAYTVEIASAQPSKNSGNVFLEFGVRILVPT